MPKVKHGAAVAKKPAAKKPGAKPVPPKKAAGLTDAEIKAQKDHTNNLKDQYLAELDKLNAMRAKQNEANA